MNQRNRRKNILRYIILIYGILVVIGAGVLWAYESRHPSFLRSSHASKDANQPIFTTVAHPTKKMTEASLQKLSQQIVSWQLSPSQAEKDTIKAFKIYYASTTPTSKSSVDYETWRQIHYNLASANQAANNQNFNVLQGYWQAIGQEIASLRTSKIK